MVFKKLFGKKEEVQKKQSSDDEYKQAMLNYIIYKTRLVTSRGPMGTEVVIRGTDGRAIDNAYVGYKKAKAKLREIAINK